MKILHVSNYYPPHSGGIEDVCFNIVQAFKSEFEQKVVCFNDSNHSILSDVDGVEVMRAGTFGKVARQALSISIYFVLKRCIVTFKPDIIHLHLPNPLICICLLATFPANTKLILHWHSDIVAQKYLYKLFAPIEKLILKRAEKILVTSPLYLQGSIPLFAYKDKVVVIPNMISLDKMNLNGCTGEIDKLKRKYGKRIVFFMGRHVPYKGIEYLIEAEKYISSDCVILLAGSGPLTEKLKRKNHSERIKFIGKISDQEIKIYMSAANVFAFPSITKNEAFGVALAEAMYCRAVPVTFTIEGSGVNWVSLKGMTGLEVKNRDAEAFGKAINQLLVDDDLRNSLAENAYKRVLDMFTMEAICDKFKKVYEEV